MRTFHFFPVDRKKTCLDNNIKIITKFLEVFSRREHIGISALAFKKTKPSKESAISNHLLNCNNIPSFEEFTILANGNNEFEIERDRLILNKNIGSAKLFLFDS